MGVVTSRYRKPTAVDVLEMIASVFVMAAGVVLSVKAMQGTSPISSLPYVISLMSGLSLGTTMVIVYTILMLIEWALIRDRSQILLTLSQLPFTIIFSLFVDAIEVVGAVNIFSGIDLALFVKIFWALATPDIR